MRNCLEFNGVFPKWNRNSVNSVNWGNRINHLSMNWGEFKDPVFHMCLAAIVVASWSLTLEVAGSNHCNNKYFQFLNSPNSVKTFRENSNECKVVWATGHAMSHCGSRQIPVRTFLVKKILRAHKRSIYKMLQTDTQIGIRRSVLVNSSHLNICSDCH